MTTETFITTGHLDPRCECGNDPTWHSFARNLKKCPYGDFTDRRIGQLEAILEWVLARQLQVGQMFGQWRCNWHDSEGNVRTQMEWYPGPMEALRAAMKEEAQ